MNTKHGFTLIELLITIGIIGILLSMSLVAISGARVKSRDAKRVADLQTIASALEQHALAYPADPYPSDIYASATLGEFLSVIPKDPKNNRYIYFKPACFNPGTSDGTSSISQGTQGSPCNGSQAKPYALEVILEVAGNQQAKLDASPLDSLKYTVVP
jgi:prepilin-type N-terminal cleavage/methylation domain-containing protein